LKKAGAEFELRTDPANPATAIEFERREQGNLMRRTTYSHAAPTDGMKSSTLISPESGGIYLVGLDAGTYYLVETKAPAGYNKLENPIVVLITHTDGNGNYTVTVNGELQNPRIVNVQNNAGTLLPSTGGIGNTIFTITGLSIMAAAVVLFLFWRKKSRHGLNGE
jgi:LPXTG-motif cell wall-anchored protein